MSAGEKVVVFVGLVVFYILWLCVLTHDPKWGADD